MATGSVSKFLGRPGPWAALWVLWFITLWILSSMSQPGPHVDMIGFDKIMHTTWFAGGGAALALACYYRKSAAPHGTSWRSVFVIVVVTGAVVGWVDEWHQSHTPGRQGLDQYDWIADVLGSVLAVPLARMFSRVIRGREAAPERSVRR